jgi:hypothetical protein
VINAAMPVQARRVFRLGLTIALSLAIAYGLNFPLPFIAPILALMLTVKPAPPMGLKGLVGLLLVLMITLGMGLLLIPILVNYPVSGVLLIAVGLYFSTYMTIHQGKALVGGLLTIGITIIPAAGLLGFYFGVLVIQALTLGMTLAIICQWIVYPFFAEDSANETAEKSAPVNAEQSSWLALRTTLIVLPPVLLSLSNPAMYLKLIMKAVALGQQGSELSARNAGMELLGSTFLGGCFAILGWFLLDMFTSLWMFFWCMLLFGVFFSSKIYGIMVTRYSVSFWTNVVITMLILLGSAVQDSANGDDVYQAFFVRMMMFIAVTLYAWLAIYTLEQLRIYRLRRRGFQPIVSKEASKC